MIAEERDVVARLRRELDAVEVRGGHDVEGLLGALHHRRRVQRRRRTAVAGAAAAVVLAVAAGGVVSWQRGSAPGIPVAEAVAEWSPRGPLVADAGLVERARAVWPRGGARVLYAGTSPNRAASMVVVVLAAVDEHGDPRVAFATTAVSDDGTPDPGRFVLRATAPVTRGQQAVGFVSAAPLPGDDPIAGGGSLGFALSAPGAEAVTLRTSTLDDQVPTPSVEPGVTWALFRPGIGAWNAVALAGRAVVPLASGAADPEVTAVTRSGSVAALRVSGATPGDLICDQDGVLGRVGADGVVDTDLAAALGPVATAVDGVPGRLVRGDGELRFAPTTADLPALGNRVLYSPPAHPSVQVTVGRITSVNPWRVEQAASPSTATAVLRVAVG
ncbi:hypothetical protein [Actinokineospora bangkokensis]|uniref:Uncharacterized protein n=1 Tax=Actinokineospora bangkokensis TaxID=1193682 RepID=A0A1Q9LF93_9PSEU|nr:hypothetical protein [Actinokineospora bangkokensis]OLR90675.1 hypothetical protein BJP25_29145 [Actinokineospora bangkokensis]